MYDSQSKQEMNTIMHKITKNDNMIHGFEEQKEREVCLHFIESEFKKREKPDKNTQAQNPLSYLMIYSSPHTTIYQYYLSSSGP
jgi:hypothetical protein